ncbi:MAG TPA: DUF362 domain-containing protein [Armatimonadota bacterium]|nr:DUF362 domain-containing protein [Armatimonadota bacterium]
MSYEVSVVRCQAYDQAQLRAAIEAGLEPLGGLAAFVHAGDRVLLKLNLLSPCIPDAAVTTHPGLVKAVIQLVQERGATAVIGDSPGGMSTEASYRALLQTTGIQQVIEETGCDVVRFDAETTTVTSTTGRMFRQFTVAKAPLDADVVIALPKLKTHQFALYTGAVKLLYGYLPGLTKVEYHLHAGKSVHTFAELLLDIYETFTPTLTIMDAVVAMEGNGPAHGTPRHLGFLLASASGPALDYVAAELIGLDPMVVPTIRAAAQRGIGPKAVADVVVHGEDPQQVPMTDFKQADTLKTASVPQWMVNLSSWLFAARPVIGREKCIKCGRCAKSCPPQTIQFSPGQFPEIEYGKCLRCYCCHELCPAGAVTVAKPRLHIPAGIVQHLAKLERLIKKTEGAPILIFTLSVT